MAVVTESYDNQQAGADRENRIFVGGLAPHTTEYTLAMHFSQYGQILEAKIVYDRATGKSKGYAFVRFNQLCDLTPQAATNASSLGSQDIDGKTVNIHIATVKPTTHTGGSSTIPRQDPNFDFLANLREKGEDLSLWSIQQRIHATVTQDPARAIKLFCERAELFRNTPWFDYYSIHLPELAREYRKTGTIGTLPQDPNLPDLSTFVDMNSANLDSMVTETSIAEIDAMVPDTAEPESMLDVA